MQERMQDSNGKRRPEMPRSGLKKTACVGMTYRSADEEGRLNGRLAEGV
jgi:hypothetical protein